MADYRTTCPAVERKCAHLVRRELEVVLAQQTRPTNGYSDLTAEIWTFEFGESNMIVVQSISLTRRWAVSLTSIPAPTSQSRGNRCTPSESRMSGGLHWAPTTPGFTPATSCNAQRGGIVRLRSAPISYGEGNATPSPT